MSANTNFLKLGLFVLVGAVFLLVGVVLLGSGALFQETIKAETYFNESVQGLSVGAPVKFRGVQMGRVSEITFPTVKYDVEDFATSSRFVLAVMEFDKELIETFYGVEGLRDKLGRAVADGLRVRLTTQGLTGVSFLELDFLDPQRNPPLKTAWTPKTMHIPSAPSTFSRIEEALNTLAEGLDTLQTFNFTELTASLNSILDKVNQSLDQAKVDQIGSLVVANLEELEQVFGRVNSLLQDSMAESIIPNLSAAIATAKRIAESSEDDIIAAAGDMRIAAEEFASVGAQADGLLESPGLKESLDELPAALEAVGLIAEDLRRASARADALLRNLNDLTVGQSSNIKAVIEESRTLLENLNELTGDLTQNPSLLIFGSPPEKIDIRSLP